MELSKTLSGSRIVNNKVANAIREYILIIAEGRTFAKVRYGVEKIRYVSMPVRWNYHK